MNNNRKDERETAFWVVWNGQGRGPPTVKHKKKIDADGEAMRLAQLHPGTTFYVLRAIRAYVAEIEIKEKCIWPAEVAQEPACNDCLAGF